MTFDPEHTRNFSPPDIGDAEADAVVEVLRSGWITTGPRTKKLEQMLTTYCDAQGFACLGSATAALECCLRALGIGPGDEVITSAYTYTASASPIVHVGATPVLCDVAPGSFEMDPEAVAAKITPATKAIIPVDLGGRMIDYDALFEVLNRPEIARMWNPGDHAVRSCFDRVMVVSDAAHSLGATYRGMKSGSVADFSTFSFHAVKNLTTAEGGGLAWRDAGFDSDAFYHTIMLLSLHGQSKDALAKNKPGAWEYDIAFPGWKCNMTDMQAAIGLVQLQRYPSMLKRRRDIIARYRRALTGAGPHETPDPSAPVSCMTHYDHRGKSSGHLMITRVIGASRDQCNRIMEIMAEHDVATNVHYKPLPAMTAYRDLGFDTADFPNAMAAFENEITLPLNTVLTDDDVDYIAATYLAAIAEVMGK